MAGAPNRFAARVWDRNGLDVRVKFTGDPQELRKIIAERTVRYLLTLLAKRDTQPVALGELWLKE